MKRRLFNALAAVSLVLCVATLALWIRSYWWSDTLACRTRYHYIDIGTARGALSAESIAAPLTEWEYPGWGISSVPQQSSRLFFPDPGVRVDWRVGGFALFISNGGTTPLAPARNFGGANAAVSATSPPSIRGEIPLWFGAVIFALPATRMAIRLARQRRAPGRCSTCGYDLRATPERCPECGTVPTASDKNDKSILPPMGHR